MDFDIVNNAIDSLKICISSFYNYNRSNSNTDLKITIVFLHNSIELLLKSIVMTTNELLIYNMDNSTTKKLVIEAIKKQREDKLERIDRILLAEDSVTTIGYSKLVEIYCDLYDYNEKTKDILDRLGKLRNNITHFGVGDNTKYNEVDLIMTETFKIIIEVMYPQLLEIDEIFSYNDFIDPLSEWITADEDIQIRLCLDIQQKKMRDFAKVFKEFIEDVSFQKYLLENNYELDTSCIDYQEYYFTININGIDIFSKYDAYYNTTSFIDAADKILFIVDNAKGNVYFYKIEVDYYSIFLNYKRVSNTQKGKKDPNRWELDLSEGVCYKKPLTKKNFNEYFTDVVLPKFK